MTNYFNQIQVTTEGGSILSEFLGGSNSDSLLYVKTLRVSNGVVGGPRWVNDATTNVIADAIMTAGIPLEVTNKAYLMLEVVGVSSSINPTNFNDNLIVLVTNKSTQTDATNVTTYHILNGVGQNLIMPWHITTNNLDALCNLDLGLGKSEPGKYYDVRVSISYTRSPSFALACPTMQTLSETIDS